MMKNFFKTLIIIFFIFCITFLLTLIVNYTSEGVKNVFSIKNTFEEIEAERKELVNNECVLATTEKIQLPLVIEKPAKGANFGTMKIPSIDVELSMMYGTTKALLSQGVGHDDRSYLPGEGGSIVLMGHNFKQFLARLPECKNGDEIILTTDYGEFHYTIYDAKVVKETQVGKVPIQKDEEILMVYTCWPIPNVSHANDRYVVYAK